MKWLARRPPPETRSLTEEEQEEALRRFEERQRRIDADLRYLQARAESLRRKYDGESSQPD